MNMCNLCTHARMDYVECYRGVRQYFADGCNRKDWRGKTVREDENGEVVECGGFEDREEKDESRLGKAIQ